MINTTETTSGNQGVTCVGGQPDAQPPGHRPPPEHPRRGLQWRRPLQHLEHAATRPTGGQGACSAGPRSGLSRISTIAGYIVRAESPWFRDVQSMGWHPFAGTTETQKPRSAGLFSELDGGSVVLQINVFYNPQKSTTSPLKPSNHKAYSHPSVHREPNSSTASQPPKYGLGYGLRADL